MTEMERFSQLARQLEAEEIPSSVLPITRTGQQFDRPWHSRNTYYWELEPSEYICKDNGKGCGEGFSTWQAKNEHRRWCVEAK